MRSQHSFILYLVPGFSHSAFPKTLSCCRASDSVLLYSCMKISLDKDISELLRTLDVLSMPAFIVDRQGTILSCNDNVHAYFEYDRSDVIGRNLENFIALHSIVRDRQTTGSFSLVDAACEGESFPSLRAFCFRKNGSPVASRVAVIPNRKHRPDRMIIVVRDALDQKTAPQESLAGLPQDK